MIWRLNRGAAPGSAYVKSNGKHHAIRMQKAIDVDLVEEKAFTTVY